MFDAVSYINTPRWQNARLGLDRIADLLERLGCPQDRLRFVHVAGTNGKGSTSSFIASALQAAGYRTGLFTSPYVETFHERIRVDGRNISDAELTAATLAVREHAEAMEQESGEHPTEFELMTAVALEHFARTACDIVVLEVGLGGRLDSTNVIAPPEVAVIARIGLDHTAILGNTIAQIAGEKAGIIKPGSTVVSWPQDPEAMAVVEAAARAAGDELEVADFAKLRVRALREELAAEDGSGAAAAPDAADRRRLVRPFAYRGHSYITQLLGSYQPQNAAVALETLLALRRRGWRIPDEALAAGIAATRWPARFELMAQPAGMPAVVVDGGHNPQGAAVLADSLRDAFPGVRPVFVMGVLADKDYPRMIEAVAPLAAAFVCATPPSPRALSANDLAAAVRRVLASRAEGLAGTVPVEAASSFSDAVARARARAGEQGLVCAFGSLYSVASLKRALGDATGVQ